MKKSLENLSIESIDAIKYLAERLTSRSIQFHNESDIRRIAVDVLWDILPKR